MQNIQRDSAAKWIVAGLVAVIVITAVWFLASMTNKTTLQLGDAVIAVKVLDSHAERQRGLSGVESLDQNEGRLFIFDRPGQWAFWMKDMNFPIDIIWLDSNKKVVHITHNVSPETYPKTFKPEVPALYVVEVPAGFAKRHNVFKGSMAHF